MEPERDILVLTVLTGRLRDFGSCFMITQIIKPIGGPRRLLSNGKGVSPTTGDLECFSLSGATFVEITQGCVCQTNPLRNSCVDIKPHDLQRQRPMAGTVIVRIGLFQQFYSLTATTSMK